MDAGQIFAYDLAPAGPKFGLMRGSISRQYIDWIKNDMEMLGICHSEKFEFNLDKLIEAITKASKATLNRMNSRITKEIQQLLDSGDNSLEDYPHSQWLYERIAELERMRKYIKLLKKMKSNRVPAKLRTLWLSRIKNSSRTLASTSLDPMSIALPVPPTFEATLSSFGRGRDLDALAC